VLKQSVSQAKIGRIFDTDKRGFVVKTPEACEAICRADRRLASRQPKPSCSASG
jgi:hypothetical protein